MIAVAHAPSPSSTGQQSQQSNQQQQSPVIVHQIEDSASLAAAVRALPEITGQQPAKVYVFRPNFEMDPDNRLRSSIGLLADLLHAQKCDTKYCTMAVYCAVLKPTLAHVDTCTADQCTENLCEFAREVLNHHAACTTHSTCEICGPALSMLVQVEQLENSEERKFALGQFFIDAWPQVKRKVFDKLQEDLHSSYDVLGLSYVGRWNFKTEQKWQKDVKLVLRETLIQRMVDFMCDEVSEKDRLFHVKNMEGKYFKEATSRQQYFHMLAHEVNCLCIEQTEDAEGLGLLRRYRFQCANQLPNGFCTTEECETCCGLNIFDDPEEVPTTYGVDKSHKDSKNPASSSSASEISVEIEPMDWLKTYCILGIPFLPSTDFGKEFKFKPKKAWKAEVDAKLRLFFAQRIVMALLADSHVLDPDPEKVSDCDDPKVRNILTYAKMIEHEAFDRAESTKQYFHLVAERVVKLDKEMELKKAQHAKWKEALLARPLKIPKYQGRHNVAKQRLTDIVDELNSGTISLDQARQKACSLMNSNYFCWLKYLREREKRDPSIDPTKIPLDIGKGLALANMAIASMSMSTPVEEETYQEARRAQVVLLQNYTDKGEPLTNGTLWDKNVAGGEMFEVIGTSETGELTVNPTTKITCNMKPATENTTTNGQPPVEKQQQPSKKACKKKQNQAAKDAAKQNATTKNGTTPAAAVQPNDKESGKKDLISLVEMAIDSLEECTIAVEQFAQILELEQSKTY